ncbi:MAG TPA: hypothetical protein VMV69_19875 [Pirellulales bacterium]|nr:hypothetical protein [Pirellulales bacterium]
MPAAVAVLMLACASALSAQTPELTDDDRLTPAYLAAYRPRKACDACRRCGDPCRCRRPKARPAPSTNDTPSAPGIGPSTEQEPGETPAPAGGIRNDAAPDLGSIAGAYGGASGPQSAGTFMIGDYLAGGAFGGTLFLNNTVTTPNVTLPNGEIIPGKVVSVTVPYGGHLAAPFNLRTFNIADNESPWPRNRVFFTSNYFAQVGDSTGLTQEMGGFERTFGEGRSSFGMRIPFWTVDPGVAPDPFAPGGQIGTFGAGTGTSAYIGDLTFLYKRALIFQPNSGNVLSVGAAVTTPTGPATFAGVTPLYTINGVDHRGSIQPWMGFYRSIGRAFDGLFVHGFSSIDAPFSAHDATFWYNDYGLGYYYKRNTNRGLTGIVPTVECHVNTPLGNRTHGVTATQSLAAMTGFSNMLGSVQYTNTVDLTSGATLVFNRRTTLTVAAVAPVSSPQPFNYELVMQLNVLRTPWRVGPPP